MITEILAECSTLTKAVQAGIEESNSAVLTLARIRPHRLGTHMEVVVPQAP